MLNVHIKCKIYIIYFMWRKYVSKWKHNEGVRNPKETGFLFIRTANKQHSSPLP